MERRNAPFAYDLCSGRPDQGKSLVGFNIELMRGEDFTLECFNDMLLDIDEYERFCETHPGYKNNRAVMAIANIKRVYQDHEENGGFLV